MSNVKGELIVHNLIISHYKVIYGQDLVLTSSHRTDERLVPCSQGILPALMSEQGNYKLHYA